LLVSVLTFTHVPLQLTVEAGQVATQAPATHDCPVAQTVPHVPQLPVSVLTFTHVPLQAMVEAGQGLAPQIFVE
jgi:hypothetical protein